MTPPGLWTAEASDIPLPPGRWPELLTLGPAARRADLPEALATTTFVRQSYSTDRENEITSVLYRDELGNELRLWND